MRVDDCCVVHASVISVWACLALCLRRVSAKQSEKSRQTLGRAFGSRAQRDKRANKLRAAKTREARSGPRFAYLQPVSTYHGPKQALCCPSKRWTVEVVLNRMTKSTVVFVSLRPCLGARVTNARLR